MCGRLDDAEELLAAKAEAPTIVVNISWCVFWPRGGVQSRQTIQQLPEAVIIFIHGSGSGVFFGEEDQRGVGPEIVRLGEVN